MFVLGCRFYYLSARYNLAYGRAGLFWSVLLNVGFLVAGFGFLSIGIRSVLSAHTEIPSGVIDVFSFALGAMGMLGMFVGANVVGESGRKKT